MGELRSGACTAIAFAVFAVLSAQLYLWAIDDPIDWESEITVGDYRFRLNRNAPHGLCVADLLAWHCCALTADVCCIRLMCVLHTVGMVHATILSGEPERALAAAGSWLSHI